MANFFRWSHLWSSDQSSWLQIHRSEFDSRRYQIFWEVVSLERGPHSLVSTIEWLLSRKRSGSGLENREYGRRDPSHWPRGTLYPKKLALTSLASGGRSVGIVRSLTQATEFIFCPLLLQLFAQSTEVVPVPGHKQQPQIGFTHYKTNTKRTATRVNIFQTLNLHTLGAQHSYPCTF
jgi:hypothetical protein